MSAEKSKSMQLLALHMKDLPPFAAIRELRDDHVRELDGADSFPFDVTAAQKKAIQKAIKRRLARIAKRKSKERDLLERFHAWVNMQVGKCGAWVHAIAHDGKALFNGYSTKGRVIESVRRNPELTMREQPYGDGPNDTAPAVFRGKPVPIESHEDQHLAI